MVLLDRCLLSLGEGGYHPLYAPPPRCPSKLVATRASTSFSSRDEKLVPATPLLPPLTNRDACNSFRIRFYENCRVTSFKPNVFCSLRPASSSPLEATLTRMPISVHSKEFTGNLTPLDATLTKNTGGGVTHHPGQNLFSPINTRLPDSLPVPRTCIHRTIGAAESVRQAHRGPRFCVLHSVGGCDE
jgi:hypothetical protein